MDQPAISRCFDQPSKNTFSILSISRFIQMHIQGAEVIVDPFARNSKVGTITNDLNEDTNAEFHMHAHEFLRMLIDKKIQADVVLLDPPYSLRQMKEIYDGIGRKIDYEETIRFYGTLRNLTEKIVKENGKVLSFGWNSIGMGRSRGFKQIEILLVCHGRAHNDTICVADQRIQMRLI